MEEELIEQRERAAHRLVDRMRPRAARFVLFVRGLPRPTRGRVAVVVLGVLLADIAVLGSRSARAPVAPLFAGERGVVEATESPGKLPPIGVLDGPSPYVVFAVENAEDDRVRVFATQIPQGRVETEFPRVFLGEYPGFIADYAGGQAQAGGAVVPINTAQETTDASRATRLWLLTRQKTARSVLSTFDFVSAYSLNHEGDALAVSRRSVSSPARGAFLWLYPLEPREARQVGSLRRPGGSGPASALRPVAWGPDEKTIFATPFCDQCAGNADRGLFVVTVADGSLRQFAPTGDRSVFSPSFSADGSRFVFQEANRLQNCGAFERCEERRLVAVDVKTGRVRDLAISRELSYDNPVISLDGTVVAYASGRSNEIVWRAFDTGNILGAIDVSPSEEVVPVAWITSKQLMVAGRTSSARPYGGSEGNLFRVTRTVLRDGTEAGAHVELVASDDTLTFLGWLR